VPWLPASRVRGRRGARRRPPEGAGRSGAPAVSGRGGRNPRRARPEPPHPREDRPEGVARACGCGGEGHAQGRLLHQQAGQQGRQLREEEQERRSSGRPADAAGCRGGARRPEGRPAGARHGAADALGPAGAVPDRPGSAQQRAQARARRRCGSSSISRRAGPGWKSATTAAASNRKWPVRAAVWACAGCASARRRSGEPCAWRAHRARVPRST